MAPDVGHLKRQITVPGAAFRHKVAPNLRCQGENRQSFYESQLYDDRANELRCCGVFEHQWCSAGEKEYTESSWELIIRLMTRFLFDHREGPWLSLIHI